MYKANWFHLFSCLFPRLTGRELGCFRSYLIPFHKKGNYPEPHSQNRYFVAFLLLMWLLRHIKLLICLNASIRRTQFCMALNSYQKGAYDSSSYTPSVCCNIYLFTGSLLQLPLQVLLLRRMASGSNHIRLFLAVEVAPKGRHPFLGLPFRGLPYLGRVGHPCPVRRVLVHVHA